MIGLSHYEQGALFLAVFFTVMLAFAAWVTFCEDVRPLRRSGIQSKRRVARDVRKLGS